MSDLSLWCASGGHRRERQRRAPSETTWAACCDRPPSTLDQSAPAHGRGLARALRTPL